MEGRANFLWAFLSGPALPDDTRHTYRWHMAYALLLAAAMGILANAPIVAVKRMDPEKWHMTLRLVLSGGGQLLVLWLGVWMATRRKMPFVVWPGLAFAGCSFAMALATRDALAFLVLLGLGVLFETVSRPAVAAVIRQNYPATHRGLVTGEIRKWSSLIFLLFTMLSALALRWAGDGPEAMVRAQMLVSGVLSVAGFMAFDRIRVRDDEGPRLGGGEEASGHLREACRIVAHDRRFRQYLLSGFLFCFGGLMYPSLMEPLLAGELGFGYVQTALLINVVPGALAFATTGAWGRWFDKTNTWFSWVAIRVFWALDALILAATPMAAAAFPPAASALPLAARLCHGSVMGGSWILWWQVGTNHFAPPGASTTRYLGLLAAMNGIGRIVAPLAGAWVATRYSIAVALAAGGAIVLLSAAHAWWHARRERGVRPLATMADFEAQFQEAVLVEGGPGEQNVARGKESGGHDEKA